MGRCKTKCPSVMQNSATSGSHGTGVSVGDSVGEAGMIVAVGVVVAGKVADGVTVAVGIEIGSAVQAERMKRKTKRTESRFIEHLPSLRAERSNPILRRRDCFDRHPSTSLRSAQEVGLATTG